MMLIGASTPDKHEITWTKMLKLQGPSRKILFIKKNFPDGMSRVGRLTSLQAAFHAFRNAFISNDIKDHIKFLIKFVQESFL
jgi:hypothetical protein